MSFLGDIIMIQHISYVPIRCHYYLSRAHSVPSLAKRNYSRSLLFDTNPVALENLLAFRHAMIFQSLVHFLSEDWTQRFLQGAQFSFCEKWYFKATIQVLGMQIATKQVIVSRSFCWLKLRSMRERRGRDEVEERGRKEEKVYHKFMGMLSIQDYKVLLISLILHLFPYQNSQFPGLNNMHHNL